MELIRTFLAVPPDEALRKRLAVLFPAGPAGSLPVGARLARDGKGGGIRWAELSGLHVTLVFLGATRPEQVVALHACVADIARTLRAFAYALGGPLLFPDARRPRVLALEPLSREGFAAWQAPLTDACAALGFAREGRRFRPHLSLARVKGVPDELPRTLAEPLPGLARDVVLYQSAGGRYRPLFSVACGDAECAA